MNPSTATQSTTASIRYVRSSRDPNQFYTVALNTRGYWECDCPSAQYRRNVPCRHVKAVAKNGAGLVATPKGQPVSRLTHAAASTETRDLVASLEV